MKIVIIGLIIYFAACAVLYFFQEKLLFFPGKLSQDFVFPFEAYEEINHTVKDGINVNSLLFKSSEKKGVVFFLHGNGGAIDGWGQGASLYVDNGYDVLYLDYRGYGKSGGAIESEKQLVNDAQVVYNFLARRYTEEKIIISGTSIGTGLAAQIAASNKPRMLILNCPYYSLTSLVKEKVPVVPAFILKYPLNTYRYLEKVKCNVTIFHGNKDDLIPVKHSIDLKKKHPKVNLNIIEGYGHNDLSASREYRIKMKALLH